LPLGSRLALFIHSLFRRVVVEVIAHAPACPRTEPELRPDERFREGFGLAGARVPARTGIAGAIEHGDVLGDEPVRKMLGCVRAAADVQADCLITRSDYFRVAVE
jgi:hypothetical protein